MSHFTFLVIIFLAIICPVLAIWLGKVLAERRNRSYVWFCEHGIAYTGWCEECESTADKEKS